MMGLVALTLMAGFQAKADMGQVMALEQSIEQRIYRAIQPMDAEAQVFAKIRVKGMNVTLPGVSFDYVGVNGISKIRDQDIESIRIRVISTLTPFPEWLKKEIKNNFSFRSVRTELQIVEFNPESLELIRGQRPLAKLTQQLQTWVGQYWIYTLAGVGILLALVMTGLALMVYWMLSFWQNQMAKVLAALDRAKGETSGNKKVA